MGVFVKVMNGLLASLAVSRETVFLYEFIGAFKRTENFCYRVFMLWVKVKQFVHWDMSSVIDTASPEAQNKSRKNYIWVTIFKDC